LDSGNIAICAVRARVKKEDVEEEDVKKEDREGGSRRRIEKEVERAGAAIGPNVPITLD
jgi:hypothetical protein